LETLISPPTVRDRLLNAAERVVARDGVLNLTLEAVAREAGVSKGGLLYHFPSKSDLIIAIVERVATECEAEQSKASAADPNPGAFTRAYLARRAEPLDPAEEPLHTAILTAAANDKTLLEPFRKRFGDIQEKFANDGIDPVVAHIVRLAIDGLCLNSLLGCPTPTGELRREILDRLIAMTRSPR
jgi:AcrR family transcriptional regulator